MSTQKDQTMFSKEYILLSQVLNDPSDTSIENFIHEAGINYTIPDDSILKEHKPHLIGYSILHFAIMFEENRDHCVDLLLKHKADVTLKNHHGMTPLRQAIEKSYKNASKRCLGLKGKLDHPLANKFLDTHCDLNVSINPICNLGVSHYHIACMMNHKRAVELFLKAGVDVNDKIFLNSPHLPGYTPLHIAARYSSLDVAETLLNFGADIASKDSRGMAPLHLLIERNVEIMNALITAVNINQHKDFIIELDSNNKIINLILEKTNIKESNIIDETGLTHLHVASTQKNKSLVQKLSKDIPDINSPICLDSPFLPGYTPLHFAAHFSFETVKLLVGMGANIMAQDKNGLTPLDLCVGRYLIKDIHWILSNQKNFKNILLSDGSKLTDVLFTMKNRRKLTKLLVKTSGDIFVSPDSPLMPAYTLLHLAILFEKKSNPSKIFALYKDVEYGLNNISASTTEESVLSLVLNSNYVIAPNLDGMTPIHLALRLQKYDIVRTCLKLNMKKAINITDQDDLSHFHIACAANNFSMVKKFLDVGVKIDWPVKSSFSWKNEKTSEETFIQSGSTPLHISVVCQRKHITELLLKHGAEPFVKDEDGLTCVHLAFARSFNKGIIDSLLSASRMDNVNPKTNEGLSHLHIACYVNNLNLVKELLKIDADINAPITSVLKSTYAENPDAVKGADYYSSSTDHADRFIFLSPYAGYTPLHFAAQTLALETIEFLIQNGANIHAKNHLGLTPFHIVLNSESKRSHRCINIFASKLKLNSNECIDDTNMTLLHLACRTLDESKLKNLLDSGADVNARIKSDSPIWPGHTPLHIVIRYGVEHAQDKIIRIINLLVKSGADLTIKNEDNLTPVHATNEDLLRKLMLGSLTALNANPIDHEGLSHFHIACQLGDANLVEAFLESGVNVNTPTDFFSDQYPGYSPFHFAIQNKSNYREIINVLLKYDADIYAENAKILSPLISLSEIDIDLVNAIFKRTGCKYINRKNNSGYTPLLWMIEKGQISEETTTLFLKHGAFVNLFCPKNSFGCLAIALWEKSEEIFNTIMNNATDLTKINDDGFNAIHNIVSYSVDHFDDDEDDDFEYGNHPTQYEVVIEQLIEKGCKLNGQDKKGRTPLHLAFEFQNSRAITALLENGADINVVNAFDKTPYFYENGRNPKCANIFREHISLLIYCSLEVSEQNMAFYGYENILQDKNIATTEALNGFVEEYVNMLYTNIDDEDDSITVSNVLSESMVALYPKMQRRIDRFFATHNLSDDYPTLARLLKLQYSKALDRKELIKPAKNSLMMLYGLPDLCNALVLEYLSNTDLNNLIAVQVENNQKDRKIGEVDSKNYRHTAKRLKTG